MSISGVNGIMWSGGADNNNQTRQVLTGKMISAVAFDTATSTESGSSPTSSSTSANASTAFINDAGAVQAFQNYMKETPLERMQDAWLKQHGLTRQEYDNMTPPEKKLKITNQMNKDIQEEIKKKIESSALTSPNILV